MNFLHRAMMLNHPSGSAEIPAHDLPEGWPGELEGLKISLVGAQDKLTQITRSTRTTIDLGIPATR
jgi:hypothetical protein